MIAMFAFILKDLNRGTYENACLVLLATNKYILQIFSFTPNVKPKGKTHEIL